MKVQKFKLYAFFYAVIAFFLSYAILPYYVYGDQWHYRILYESCFFDTFEHIAQFDCYTSAIGSSEPVFFYIIKFAQYFFEKDLFISFANAFLVYLIVYVSFQNYKKWHRHLFMLLVLTNYYLIVLMFAAERLKFAFIFFLLAAFFSNKILKGISAALSILTHSQMLILLVAYLIRMAIYMKIRLYKKISIIVIGFAGVSAVVFTLKAHILNKYDSISSSADVSDVGVMGALKASLLIVVAALSTRKFDPIVFASPLILAAFFLGSARIVIMVFFMYVAYIITEKKQMDIPLFLVLLYFSYKSIDFVQKIIETGSGYTLI